jgi:single-stranded DNA-binding protein
MCEGRLTVDRETGEPRVWQDQNGKWRTTYEMTAFEVKFLGQRAEGGGSFEGSTQDSRSGEVEGASGIMEDEIPF